jgi:hypothetical protein
MLKSNQITITLQGTAYSGANRLLHERAQLLAKVAEFRLTDKGDNQSPDVEKVKEIERQLIHILGTAVLDKVLAG